MKKCSCCQYPKSIREFGRRSKAADGLNPRCLECMRQTHNSLYRNSVERRLSIKAATAAQIQINKQFVFQYLTEHPCVDCGESDVIVLEFDHVRGVKRREISRMVYTGTSLETLQKEIAKCDVRCANCHRRKTHAARNAYVTSAATVPVS